MLSPVALLYGAITAFRNYLFDKEIIKSFRFDFPLIGVGNLSAGGTGKTPHVEYLISLLQYTYRVATLSRGYGRRSHGFVLAGTNSSADDIGDEPRQFKKKFPDTIVAVGENRVLAVPRILDAHPETDVILLDDAFQHRSIHAGLSLLVTDYANLFTRDYLIPIGWLRESNRNYHRADIIIVSKCPPLMSIEEKEHIIAELRPFRYQHIYFTTVQYGALYSFTDNMFGATLDKDTDVLLVCGIARYDELETYLRSRVRNVFLRGYRDHHRFDAFDLQNILDTFDNLGDTKKMMITTEKDAARLETYRHWFLQNKIEIFVQPIRIDFLFGEKEKFDADIVQYIETTRQNVTN